MRDLEVWLRGETCGLILGLYLLNCLSLHICDARRSALVPTTPLSSPDPGVCLIWAAQAGSEWQSRTAKNQNSRESRLPSFPGSERPQRWKFDRSAPRPCPAPCPAPAPPLPRPLESYAEKNSGLESGSAAASGRSFGPCEPPSGAALFRQRELRRRQEPASAWLKSASRPHHGRAWPGAGVYDPGPAGAGQVGPGRRLTCSPFPATDVPAPIP